MSRFLLYSHDTYGLGHLRRTTLVAAGLVAADEANEVLIVTGSPRADAFRLPDRVDTVKLPCATKDDRGHYRPRSLRGGIDALVRLRAGLIESAVLAFEPDVVLVDHAPTGMRGELVPLLDRLGRMADRPRLVLGLRDVIDEAGRVDAAWHRDGTWGDLDHYDRVLVYGDPSVTTTAIELAIDRRVRGEVVHTGYIASTMPEPLAAEPFLLVTPGGGGDGQGLLRRYLDAVADGATGGLRSVVVTGPLLSAGRRAELMTRAERLPSVEMVQFSDRLRSLIASAIGVVSMAGYNTVVEELAAGTPALLAPRCAPRLEQHLRATRLAPRTTLEHLPLEAVDPARVRGFVERCRAEAAGDRTTPSGVALDGVANAVRALVAVDPTEPRRPTGRLARAR